MKLSVILVNYNVRYFLEQCLHSVRKACTALDAEVFVVDNNSVDGSCQLVREKFPEVILIENHDNKGFSIANNQAIRQAKGEYVLLLNPDTVVEEDCFAKCVAFMDNHPEAGALGVKMIDGKGRLLPESKRALPTPLVAFYKIFGFSRLFPKSKQFARYHLGHLHPDHTHEVDVLAGAFMLLRKKTLDTVGLLDEAFFMYGEDIDLSYRITQAGYKNYYFPETTIIHYKGESTKKGSLNYVRLFYQAMIIFARKHFSKEQAGLFSLLIRLAIYFRALLSITQRVVSAAFFPVLDATIIYAGYRLLVPWWENYRFEPGHFPPAFLQYVVPVYLLSWLIGIRLAGGYRKPVKPFRVWHGLAWGTLGILLFYSLADESWRFSRALILLGAAWAFAALWAVRLLLGSIPVEPFRLATRRNKKVAVVARQAESTRITHILNDLRLPIELAGTIYPNADSHPDNYLGNLSHLQEIVTVHDLDELIFSASDLPSSEIIGCMLKLANRQVAYKIAPPESLSIIGSNSAETAGDLYVVQLNAISTPKNKRHKRLLDLGLSALFLVTFPATYWIVREKSAFLSNIIQVLFNQKTWVGYASAENLAGTLPPLKPGVINPASHLSPLLSSEKKLALDLDYARNYRILKDVKIIFNNLKNPKT
ncbi:glycosyltransferase family 2 protein [Gaoshiqia sediminis]|uniref:Glycosyltransferase family 2 protein n=1 Tax=Gaoshiqia sediminis TaxID=2986998 RepID=A0AA42C8G1_9BACT|nr:glycosyltransferase [Gaoshiqia sediminis]MCW0481157.1 glycosyltransferase family 2 protein [Gaoshiqia sediminis]